MKSALTTPRSAEIVRPQEWMGDEAQIAIIRRDLAAGLDDQEFQVYLGVCKSTGLNPILRQIHAIKRRDKSSPTGHRIAYQVGIDGLRLIADRSGAYAGSDEPQYVVDKAGKPVAATVTVWKIVAGVRCPFSATARWSEYYPGEGEAGFFWRKFPFGQLGKCAEALALRKAFPAETSGIYSHEEMQQADAAIDVESVSVPMPRRRSEQPVAPSAPAEPTQPDIEAELAEQDRIEAELAAAQHETPELDWSGNWARGIVQNVSVKTGGSGDRAWRLVGGKLTDGRWYNTFSESVGKMLEEACQRGAPVFIQWEPNKKYADKRDALEVRFA